MGQRGPAPTSKKTLKQRGSWLAKHREDDLEVEISIPKPPASLCRESKAEWNRIVKVLKSKGVLSQLDRAGMTIMCQAWATDQKLGKVLDEAKVFDPKKYSDIDFLIGSEDWKRVFSARQQVRGTWTALASRFGMTPADRPRIKVGKTQGKKDNGKAKFFKEPHSTQTPRPVA